jgi:glucokinase
VVDVLHPDAPVVTGRFLAIALSPSRLAAGIVDQSGEVLVRDRVATPSRHVWPTLVRLVRRVVAAAPEQVRPVGCGVAFVGAVDHVTGRIVVPNSPGWDGFPDRAELEQVIGVPLALDSVGRGLVLAERWCGSAVGLDDVIAVHLGDSVDAGIVVDGRLAGGRTGGVGRIGHVVVEPEGRLCTCGALGCLEAYASISAIEADTGRPLPRTPVAIIERSGIMVGRVLASLAALVDTTELRVGGPIVSVFGAPLLEAMTREVEQRARLSHLAGIRVLPLPATSGGPLVAAAAIAREATARTADRPTATEDEPGATAAGASGATGG